VLGSLPLTLFDLYYEAPLALLEAGVGKNKKLTSYPSIKDKLLDGSKRYLWALVSWF
jgi:putative intracellular protease/amidase